ncbi:hypothetical protein R6Q59_030848 [Mikania micrantha]
MAVTEPNRTEPSEGMLVLGLFSKQAARLGLDLICRIEPNVVLVLCSKAKDEGDQFVMHRSKWVLIKVNIYVWRTQMERILTKEALAKRGGLCCVSFAGERNESAVHLFSSCFTATMLWQGISSWCKLQPSKTCSRYIDWKDRNEIIFKRRPRQHHTILKEVQSLSFFGVKQRAKWESLTWED